MLGFVYFVVNHKFSKEMSLKSFPRRTYFDLFKIDVGVAQRIVMEIFIYTLDVHNTKIKKVE